MGKLKQALIYNLDQTVLENLEINATCNRLSKLTPAGSWFELYISKNDLNLLRLAYPENLDLVTENIEIDMSVNFSYSKLTKLPNNIRINGSLWLNQTDLINLPKKLYVRDGIILPFHLQGRYNKVNGWVTKKQVINNIITL